MLMVPPTWCEDHKMWISRLDGGQYRSRYVHRKSYRDLDQIDRVKIVLKGRDSWPATDGINSDLTVILVWRRVFGQCF